jgi:hypothetical protein
MKKIFIIMLCAMLIFALPVVAYASETVPTEGIVTEEVSITETIIDYVKSHIEEILVIVSIFMSAFINNHYRGNLKSSIGKINNNAITIADNGAAVAEKALVKLEEATIAMREERQHTEGMISNVETFLETTRLATIELANEVAELLVLANIPNSKKDELYARHMKAVQALEEVMSNDGKEA